MSRNKSPLNKTFKELVNSEYNKEPVYYCKRCLSLNIRVNDNNEEFCEDCASTNVVEGNIFEWESLYKQMYGKSFLK